MDSSDEYDAYDAYDDPDYGESDFDDDYEPVYRRGVISWSVHVEQCGKTNDEEKTETTPEEVGEVRSLFLQAADAIGARYPFEAVELWSQRLGKGMTDEVQLAVMRASFPVDKELIRHYAYLSRKANGYHAFSDLKYEQERSQRDSERLTVKKIVQIGFTLTGTILVERRYNRAEQQEIQVAASVDRQRIISTLCSAHPECGWCQHVVKLIFYRMDYPHKVEYRLPVSDSVQRLSVRQQKQFINILLSSRPLEMLALAQETLDQLFQQEHSQLVVGGDSLATDMVEVPDLTAGGGLDDDGLWAVEGDDVRRIVSNYCSERTRLGRYIARDAYGEPSAVSWLSDIRSVRRNDDTKRTAVIDKLFHVDRLNHPVSYGVEKELGGILYLIADLFTKGEQSAVAVLGAITEQWLEKLIQQARTTDEIDQEASGISECDSSSAAEDMVGPGEVFQHVKNLDFLCTSNPWFLPDRLAICWRAAVFASALNDDTVETIKSKLLTWGQQLDQAVAAGLRKAEVRDKARERAMTVHNWSHYRHMSDGALWRSLLGWNGFKHTAALFNQKLHSIFSLLSNTSIEFTTSLVLPHRFKSKRAEILNTAAYLVLCLLDKGMDEAAKGLARLCTTAILSLSFAEPLEGEARSKEGPIGPMQRLVTDVLSAIAQCHEEMSSSLWGDQSKTSVGMALVILFKAIETEDWAWSDKMAYNLKPWLRSLVGESLLHSLVDASEDSVSMVSSQGMFLGLLCVVTCRDTKSPSLMEEVECQVKKNEILSKLCNKMAEQSEALQQFIELAPVLQKYMACLDAPATAILLLQIAILSQLQNQTNVDIVLSAVATSLHHQARFQIDMLTGNSSSDFYCYQTQSAASSLLALAVYGQSKATASVIIRSFTDLLLELLQRRRDILLSSDTDITTGDKGEEQNRQTVTINNGRLEDYIKDMTSIVEALSGQSVRRSHYYGRQNALAERLEFMKSPVTELIPTYSSNRKRPPQDQSGSTTVMTSRLREIQQQHLPVKWPTVVELLLILLTVDAAAEERRQCREPIIELLKEAADCVGTVTFLEMLSVKEWDAHLTVEEVLTCLLTRQAFQKSFRCTEQRRKSPAAIGVLEQMFVVCASSVTANRCAQLYQAAWEFGMIDCLVSAALSDDCDLKQKAPHNLLFCLAHSAIDTKMISQRFQIGVEAVRRWQQHAGNDSRRHASITAILDRGYSHSDEHIAVVGLLRLAALAVFIDKEPVMTRRKSKKSIKWLKVESLFGVFAQDWIDPLFAFILLLEVSRLSHDQWEAVALLATGDHPETWKVSTLTNILAKQREFMQSPSAATLFREVCGTCIPAHDLAYRCKTRLAAFMTHSKQLAENGMSGSSVNSGNDELPSREVCLRDFISLEHLCQVFPEDQFDFESLLKSPHQESRRRMYHYKYQNVVKEFELFRRRRNGEEQDVRTEDQQRVRMMEVFALQQLMQQQVGQTVLGLPFFYDDDPDEYY